MTVMAGCGQAGTPSAAAPTGTAHLASSSPGLPQTSATAPTTSTATPVVGPGSMCKMPIGWLENDAQNRKAAILSVPDGALVEDTEGALVYDQSRYLWRTTKLPYLYGDIAGGMQRGGGAGTMFDAAYSRWLPVGSKSVSPDGAAYAYSQSFSDGRTAELHLVSVASGADRVLVTGNWYVLDFETSGIYVGSLDNPGIWLLNPNTAALRQLTKGPGPWSVFGGFGWSTAFDPTDPHPQPAMGGFAPNLLVRLDLTTGVVTPWVHKPGAAISIVGADMEGHPLIEVFSEAHETDLVTGSEATKRLFLFTTQEPMTPAAIDSHGVWFKAMSGWIWLSAGGGELTRIVQVPTAGFYGGDFNIAGPCV
jgi:hypothetical protein